MRVAHDCDARAWRRRQLNQRLVGAQRLRGGSQQAFQHCRRQVAWELFPGPERSGVQRGRERNHPLARDAPVTGPHHRRRRRLSSWRRGRRCSRRLKRRRQRQLRRQHSCLLHGARARLPPPETLPVSRDRCPRVDRERRRRSECPCWLFCACTVGFNHNAEPSLPCRSQRELPCQAVLAAHTRHPQAKRLGSKLRHSQSSSAPSGTRCCSRTRCCAAPSRARRRSSSRHLQPLWRCPCVRERVAAPRQWLLRLWVRNSRSAFAKHVPAHLCNSRLPARCVCVSKLNTGGPSDDAGARQTQRVVRAPRPGWPTGALRALSSRACDLTRHARAAGHGPTHEGVAPGVAVRFVAPALARRVAPHLCLRSRGRRLTLPWHSRVVQTWPPAAAAAPQA